MNFGAVWISEIFNFKFQMSGLYTGIAELNVQRIQQITTECSDVNANLLKGNPWPCVVLFFNYSLFTLFLLYN